MTTTEDNTCAVVEKHNCQCDPDGKSVCEEALDQLVHRVLLSATMNDKDNEAKFGIADVDDGKIKPMDYRNKPKVNSEKVQERYERSQNKKPINRKKEARRNKWEKMDNGQGNDMSKAMVKQVNGQQYVNVPLEVYRKMVDAEIDGKMKQVQDYYEYYSKQQEDLRLEALRETVYWKECCKRIEISLSLAYNDLDELTEMYNCSRSMLSQYQKREKESEQNSETYLSIQQNKALSKASPNRPLSPKHNTANPKKSRKSQSNANAQSTDPKLQKSNSSSDPQKESSEISKNLKRQKNKSQPTQNTDSTLKESQNSDKSTPVQNIKRSSKEQQQSIVSEKFESPSAESTDSNSPENSPSPESSIKPQKQEGANDQHLKQTVESKDNEDKSDSIKKIETLDGPSGDHTLATV